VSGQKALELKGTVVQIQRQFLAHLLTVTPRDLKEGKSITLRMADKPMELGQKTSAEIEAEAWSHIQIDERDSSTPLPEESYESYRDRLIAGGMAVAAAEFFAADWFGQLQDVQTVRWMHDQKAQRFTQLNSSKTEYESALPSEYETLKAYVQREYPERAAQITFRTA
jgi:hypothetical protein